MLDFAAYVKIFIALLVIVNPIGTMPMFLGLTHKHGAADKKRIARVASISVAVVLTASAVLGEHLLGSSASPSLRSRSAGRSSSFCSRYR